MKTHILCLLATLLLGLTLQPISGEAHKKNVNAPSKACHPSIYDTWLSNKDKAISCTRSREQQAALRRHFIRMGRFGQAAKNSRHVIGCACDFTTRALRNRHGLWLNAAGHSGNHLSDTGH